MSCVRTALLATAAVVLGMSSTAALAQKSKDTVRVAVNEPFPQLDPLHYPQTEASFVYSNVYSTLIAFDERSRQFVPWIAKSWKRIGDATLEFEIYDDIAFHSGNKLTADDVAYSLNYGADPNVKMPFKGRYLWVTNVEKTGPYAVRVHFKSLFADDLMHLAFRGYVLDSKVHASYQDKTDYGRKTPVGSGIYKVVDFDRTAGITIERFDGAKKYPFVQAPIKTVKTVFIPDEQTRLAQLLVGNVDLLYNVSADNARELKANPNLKVTAVDQVTTIYLGLDVVGRTGHKELQDPRVRQAIFMAIDRDAILKNIVPGGENASRLEALCFDSMPACDHSSKPPAYDPAGARKLLADAGYANGFDIMMDVHTVVRPMGEAIAGYLRAVGIRATVNPILQTIFFKRRAAGEFAMITSYAPARNFPEASYILDNLFGVAEDDYVRDEKFLKAMAAGYASHDVDKRRAAYKVAFDRLNELYAFLPIGSLPVVFAHSKDIRMEPHPLSKTRESATTIYWN